MVANMKKYPLRKKEFIFAGRRFDPAFQKDVFRLCALW
jgi:hypothetical protein